MRREGTDERHVLNEDGIDACLCQLVEQAAGVVELIVVDDGVDGDVDLDAVGTGIVAELADVVDAVAGGGTGTEALGTDVDGVGTVVNGGYATFQVLGGSQQFEWNQCLMLNAQCLMLNRRKRYLLSLIYYLLLDIIDIIRRLLIDVVVDPVGVEQVGMGAPRHQRRL